MSQLLLFVPLPEDKRIEYANLTVHQKINFKTHQGGQLFITSYQFRIQTITIAAWVIDHPNVGNGREYRQWRRRVREFATEVFNYIHSTKTKSLTGSNK